MDIKLREVEPGDLPIFFEQQLDPAANQMAAFTVKNPADPNAFAAHWAKIQADASVTIRTILFESRVAGYVAGFVRGDEPEVTYWIGREFWGKGITTAALSDFLKILKIRPLLLERPKITSHPARPAKNAALQFTDMTDSSPCPRARKSMRLF